MVDLARVVGIVVYIRRDQRSYRQSNHDPEGSPSWIRGRATQSTRRKPTDLVITVLCRRAQ
jgi:hypothetical protein